MSFRGGRGGGGAGRGGLKGATWEHDEDLEIEARKLRSRAKGKTTLFPEHPTGANIKKPQPLTAREKRQVRHLKNLQEQIHRGPLYTQPTKRNVDTPIKIFGEDQFNAQYGTDKKANMDPFTEGVETYSDKYAPKKNIIPKLSGRPFNKEFFPKELWSTLDGTEGEEVRRHLNRAILKKSLMLGSESQDSAAKTKMVLAQMDAIGADDDVEEMEEEEQEEEEQDDAFDDEELGDDYNAEQYFDNGDDRDEDEGGGGDDY